MTDLATTYLGSEVEQMYCDVVRQVKSAVYVPLAVKLGHFFASIPQLRNFSITQSSLPPIISSCTVAGWEPWCWPRW